MGKRLNSWMLVLLVAAGAAVVYGVLVLYRMGADLSVADLLRRMPDANALTLHVDLRAIRAAGMGGLLEGSAVAEEEDYRRFVRESGFDWTRDLDAVTATKGGDDWFLFGQRSAPAADATPSETGKSRRNAPGSKLHPCRPRRRRAWLGLCPAAVGR